MTVINNLMNSCPHQAGVFRGDLPKLEVKRTYRCTAYLSTERCTAYLSRSPRFPVMAQGAAGILEGDR